MAALWNKRRERFCQLIASGLAKDVGNQGLTQKAAYLAAGYQAGEHGAAVCASRLLRQVDEVIRRVRELATQHATRKAVTVDTISAELDEARQVAKDNDQASAMVAASGTKAKLYGLFIDRVEQGKAGEFNTSESTSDLADKLIKASNPGIVQVSDGQRAMVAEELARHASALRAIAHDTDQTTTETKPRLAGMRPKPLKHKDISAAH